MCKLLLTSAGFENMPLTDRQALLIVGEDTIIIE